MDDRKLAELADRAKHLTALANSPSYPTLKQIIEDKIRVQTRNFISVPTVDRQALDWGRGFMNGLATVLRTIEGGEKELERAVQRAQALEALEQEA